MSGSAAQAQSPLQHIQESHTLLQGIGSNVQQQDTSPGPLTQSSSGEGGFQVRLLEVSQGLIENGMQWRADGRERGQTMPEAALNVDADTASQQLGLVLEKQAVVAAVWLLGQQDYDFVCTTKSDVLRCHLCINTGNITPHIPCEVFAAAFLTLLSCGCIV